MIPLVAIELNYRCVADVDRKLDTDIYIDTMTELLT